MARYDWLRGSILGLCVMTAAACGDSNGGPLPSLTTPSPTPTPSLNLAGTWMGMIGAAPDNPGQPPDPNALQAQWVASQSGSSVTGPITLTFAADGEPIRFTGTMAGTLEGPQLALNITFSPGSIATAPGCAITATGMATPTASQISSRVAVTFGSGCRDISESPTETDQLTLTRQ